MVQTSFARFGPGGGAQDMTDWRGRYPVSIALVHYPVMDKNGLVTATSTTNFDIHDLSRLARTFGLEQYYLVTPVPTQLEFVQRIMDHWEEGWGATYNPTRRAAMNTIRLVKDLSEAADHIAEMRGRRPLFVATSARPLPHRLTFPQLAERIRDAMNEAEGETPEYCIVFGTGWGLHPSLIAECDLALEPIPGLSDDYNHLSVRAAASIIIDRLISLL